VHTLYIAETEAQYMFYTIFHRITGNIPGAIKPGESSHV